MRPCRGEWLRGFRAGDRRSAEDAIAGVEHGELPGRDRGLRLIEPHVRGAVGAWLEARGGGRVVRAHLDVDARAGARRDGHEPIDWPSLEAGPVELVAWPDDDSVVDGVDFEHVERL